jgi:uncharacterized protein (DUF4213/DUF364 family)
VVRRIPKMPGEIVGEILSSLKDGARNIGEVRVSRIQIGLGYTGVQLSTGHMGVSHTLMEDHPECCQVVKRAGRLAGSSALKMANLARSWEMIEAVVGVATINALSQMVFEMGLQGCSIVEDTNFIEYIDVRRTDTVALVGNIDPFISTLKAKARNLIILERSPRLRSGENVLPDTACEEVLPRADVVIITGTALINGTIDRLLELSKDAREVGIVGPTASSLPDPLFKRGVTAIGGVRVVDAEGAMRVIAEGGGVPQLKESCRQIVIQPIMS